MGPLVAAVRSGPLADWPASAPDGAVAQITLACFCSLAPDRDLHFLAGRCKCDRDMGRNTCALGSESFPESQRQEWLCMTTRSAAQAGIAATQQLNKVKTSDHIKPLVMPSQSVSAKQDDKTSHVRFGMTSNETLNAAIQTAESSRPRCTCPACFFVAPAAMWLRILLPHIHAIWNCADPDAEQISQVPWNGS